jgi:anti-sigma factor RsiW
MYGSANRRRNRARSQNNKTPLRHAGRSVRSKKPNATCKHEVDFLDRYLSAGLNARELKAFESHLAICEDCVAFVKTYKATIELTRNFLASRAREELPRTLSLKPAHARVHRR